MSRKRPRNRNVSLRRWSWIAVGSLGLVVFFVKSVFLRTSSSVASPDTTSMEVQVAEKILSTRNAVKEKTNSPSLWGRLGMVFQAHELFEEAIESYAKAGTLGEKDYRWPYLEAQCLKELRQLEGSLEVLKVALELNSNYAPLLVFEAELYEQQGNVAKARASYLKALDADSLCVPAYYGLGRLSLTEGNSIESKKYLEKALELAPLSGAIHSTLARLHRRLGDREEAVRSAALARKLHPEVPLNDPVMAAVGEEAVSVVGLQNRAVEAESRGEPRRAEALLRQMITLRPEESDLYYNLANNLSRQGRLEEAEVEYRNAITKRSDHVSALINLGNVLSQRNALIAAEKLYKEVLGYESDHAGALASLAKIAIRRGETKKAVEYLELAIEQDPSRAETHYVLGQIFRNERMGSEAVSSFRQAVKLAPERGDIHIDLAVTYAQQGQFAESWAHVREAEGLGFSPPVEFLAALKKALPKTY